LTLLIERQTGMEYGTYTLNQNKYIS